MGYDHAARTITITLSLDPAPASQQGFSDILLLVDLATNPLSDRVTTFGSYPEAVTAQAGGDISAGTLSALQSMFSQAPTLARVKVGTVDTAGGETWAQGYAACVAADEDVYGIVMASRTAADVVAVSDAIEAEGTRRLFAQSADADWLTSGVPSAYSSIVDNERTTIIYHDDSTEFAAEGYAAAYLVRDPDEISSTAALQVRGIAAYSTPLTSAQADFAVANDINIGMAMGSASFFVMDGVSITGRALYELTSADWLSVRLQEDLANLRVERSAFGLKIPVNEEGMALVLATIRRRLAQGEAVGHFSDSVATGETVTEADRDAQRLRVGVVAQIAGDAVYFPVSINLSRDPIATE